eukprot:3099317-Pyramimonas_sp.AAC.1
MRFVWRCGLLGQTEVFTNTISLPIRQGCISLTVSYRMYRYCNRRRGHRPRQSRLCTVAFCHI